MTPIAARSGPDFARFCPVFANRTEERSRFVRHGAGAGRATPDRARAKRDLKSIFYSSVRQAELFRILSVDSSDSAVFRLKLREWKGDEEFRADVREALLNHDQRLALQKGEWDRKPIEASINVKRLRGEITSAEIVSVKLPEEE